MGLRRATINGAIVALIAAIGLTGCQLSKSRQGDQLPAPSRVVGTLPPASGPPVISVLPGATGVAATSSPLAGQTITSNGPITVAGIRLTEAGTTVVATKVGSQQRLWSFRDAKEPDLLEFVAGGGVVAIAVGHLVGSAMIYAATEYLDVVDLATGTPLWRTTVPGDQQSPALTAMPGLVVFETFADAVAVRARSGVRAWTASSPPGCGYIAAASSPAGPVSMTSDERRLVATFPCQDGAVTERLNPLTGAPLWTTPDYSPGEGNLLAAPVNTHVVVIPEMGSGPFLTGPSRAWTPPGVTEAMSGGAIYTVLDDTTGRALWTETGAPIYNTGPYGNNDGTLCFIGEHTYECRAPTTGALIRAGGRAY